MTFLVDLAAATDSPDFTWEKRERRYRNKATGKFISPNTVKALTLRRIELVTEELKIIGGLLSDGKITLGTWQKETAGVLKVLHAQQYLIGVGGSANIQKQDYLAIGRKLKEQYNFLRNFAIDLNRGMSLAQFRHRLSLYAKAAKGSFFAGQRTAAKRSGKTYVIRQLGEAEHCVECESYATQGMVPIDEAILPTEKCSCGPNCHCQLLYLTLEQALQINRSNIEEEVEFQAGDYIVDKNGRWRDVKTGRFINMPDIKNESVNEYLVDQLSNPDKLKTAKNIIKDINKLKLLNLTTANAYAATVEQLRRKYKADAFAQSVISTLQLERGVNNKKNAINNIEELEKLFSLSTDSAGIDLTQKLREISLKTINELNTSNLNQDSDKNALNVVSSYQESIKEINDLVNSINKLDINDEDYERLYNARNLAWQKLKTNLEAADRLKDTFLSDASLDDYIDAISQISREAIGGIKIAIPNEIETLKERAKALEC